MPGELRRIHVGEIVRNGRVLPVIGDGIGHDLPDTVPASEPFIERGRRGAGVTCQSRLLVQRENRRQSQQCRDERSGVDQKHDVSPHVPVQPSAYAERAPFHENSMRNPAQVLRR